MPHIEEQSEEVQDILSHVPNWLIRWGVTVIFSILVLLFAMAWIIKYPDTLTGTATLSTQKASVKIVSKTSGELVKLNFKENELVNKGEQLAEITSTIGQKGISFLKSTVKTVDSLLRLEIPAQLQTPKSLILGEGQAEFHHLQELLASYARVQNQKTHEQDVRRINDRITFNKQLLEITQEQVAITAQELENKAFKYEGNKLLFKQGSMAKFEFLSLENDYLQKKKEYQSVRKSALQIQLTVAGLESDLDQLTQEHQLELNTLRQQIDQSLHNINRLVANWSRNYVLLAPIDGRLSYLSQLNEQEFVSSGTALFNIIPQSDSLIAHILIPVSGSGKLAIGQKTRLRFSNYPDHEYGIVRGEVSNISLQPQGNMYRVEVLLENGLTTSYNKEIQFKPEMTGQAEITVDNIRLIDRIFNQLRSALKRS